MATGSDLRAETEAQGKALQEHVSTAEANFSSILQDFAAITRKTGKLRDKGDLLAKTLDECSKTEAPSLKSGLSGCSECFAGLEDYRETLIARLESKVVQPLTEYGNVCKKAREELRSRKVVLEREVAKQRALDRIVTREPADTSRKRQARQEVSKAHADSVRAQKAFSEHMINFETKKSRDLFSVFSEYIQAHMAFHGKALELYTVAYQNILSIDEQGDLLNFRQRMNIKTDMEGDDQEQQQMQQSRLPITSSSEQSQQPHEPNHDDDDTESM
eukprot:m.276421 g.276421  ORF g.276421 m.276421 type:complete len:274 (+) comp40605_c0_seq9:24-845(+)